jgi:pilus assembly protein FimV
MGAQIDPANPLYGGASPSVAFEAATPASKPDLDFDLDSAPASQPVQSAPADSAMSFDLDLGAEKPSQPDLSVGGAAAPALDFDLAPSSPATDSSLAAEAPKDEKPAFDFDLSGLDFPDSSMPPAASVGAVPDPNLSFDKTIATAAAQTQTASLNLADLSLDDGAGAEANDAVTTKLELAKAYLEIGDKDGAREILQEVAKEGSAAQKDEAQRLIASL